MNPPAAAAASGAPASGAHAASAAPGQGPSSVKASQKEGGGCTFWLPQRHRACGQRLAPGSAELCHQHVLTALPAGGGGGPLDRVPCPADPSHTVVASYLERHLKKCNSAKLAAELQAQPFNQPGANAGSDAEAGLEAQPGGGAPTPEAAAAYEGIAADPFGRGTSARRLQLARAAGRDALLALVAKVEAAHAALAAAHPRVRRVLGGADAEDDDALRAHALAVDPNNPFNAKHARQQASLVANMSAEGLLADPACAVFVELGAGKGWLSAWLAGATGAQRIVLLDRQVNFSFKADRRLRHTALTRVACDLRDLDAAALLAHHAATATVTGKLGPPKRRRPLSEEEARRREERRLEGLAKQQQKTLERKQRQQQQEEEQEEAGQLDGQQDGLQNGQQLRDEQQAQQLQGRGQDGRQQAQEGRAFGLPPDGEDGPQLPPLEPLPNPAPWVAHGKHLCGAATDMALRACLATVQAEQQQQQQQQRFQLRGLAIATCCHHRCCWRAYVGKRSLAAFGIAPWEFEVLAWCTSWACCGHDTPAGAATDGGECEGAGDDACGNKEDAGAQGAASGGSKAAAGAAEAASGDAGGAADRSSAGTAGGTPEFHPDFHPAGILASREERMAFGLKCKRLIDLGRAVRLAEVAAERAAPAAAGAGGAPHACVVEYIDGRYTGENTALLLSLAR